jgi:hypothetical protein
MTAAPSFLLKIIYNTHAESGGVLARHTTEVALGMIRAWLAAIKECAEEEDPKVSKAAQAAGYLCLGVQLVLIFTDLYLAAPEGMKPRLSIRARMPPVNVRHVLLKKE